MWAAKPGPGQASPCAKIQLQEAAPSMGLVVGKFVHPPSVVSVSPRDVAELRLVNPLQREHQNAQRSAHFCCWLHLQGGILSCAFQGRTSLHRDPPSLLLPGSALATAGGWFVPSPPPFSPQLRAGGLCPCAHMPGSNQRIHRDFPPPSRGLQAGSQTQSSLVHAGSQLSEAQLGLEILPAFISSVWSCVLPHPISICLEDT